MAGGSEEDRPSLNPQEMGEGQGNGRLACGEGARLVVFLRNKCPQDKKNKAKRMRQNMTNAEIRLWRRIRCDALGVRARRQVVMRGYIVDFYIPRWKLIIEVDGKYHENQVEYDRKRDSDLARIGFKTLRFTNDRVLVDLEAVVSEIQANAR